MNNYFTRYIVKAFCAFLTAAGVSALLTGCSAGKSGLMQITPQQYFYSAKEKLETINERAYDIRDLDEIIRVLQSAEKDAKSGEIIDKSRLYLVLACSLKARKQYQSNILKGEYLANRPEPFFVLDVKPVQETLREAKKWLRSCEAGWKTKSLDADLQFVKGYYYTQKMLTQKGSEHGDELTPQGFLGNNAGGVLGGISTGQDVVARIAVKPTSSIRLPRRTINVAGESTEISTLGRHDPCVGIRATPIAEAMMALVLIDAAPAPSSPRRSVSRG